MNVRYTIKDDVTGVVRDATPEEFHAARRAGNDQRTRRIDMVTHPPLDAEGRQILDLVKWLNDMPEALRRLGVQP